jgi:hypothetical protein
VRMGGGRKGVNFGGEKKNLESIVADVGKNDTCVIFVLILC